MELAIERPVHSACKMDAGLLCDHSFEMTAKDVSGLQEAAHVIAPGTQISITFLPGEDFSARLRAAAMVRRLGFVPVPHISARRIASADELAGFVDGLASEADVDHVFLVAGDRQHAQGPYEDALALIRSGVLQRAGIRHAGIAGYPEGHPDIAPEKLWQALLDKRAALADLGLGVSIVTQFGFDSRSVIEWLAQVRTQGVDAPVRIGVPGPASVKMLLRYAARCGVGASAKVLGKYGISITGLLKTAGPAALITALADGLDPLVHGTARLHFYSFGGLARTAQWVDEFQRVHHV